MRVSIGRMSDLGNAKLRGTEVIERPRLLRLPGSLNGRSTALTVLAILGTIYFLRAAQAVFIPITIAAVAACMLAPIVDWLRRVTRIPRPLGAAATLLVLCALLGIAANSLQPQVMRVLDVVPRATAKFSQALRENARNHNGALQKLDRAATEIERAAAAANTPGASAPRALANPPAGSAAPSINVRDYIVMGTADAVAGFGQLIVVLSLTYFLLISSDSFRSALVRASGPTLSRKKAALRIRAKIISLVQRYLALQFASSALLGIVVGIAFSALGLDSALFWACCGAVLHMIPYVGPAVFVVIVTMLAYVQFHSWVSVVAISISIVLSTGIIGMLLVPWWTHKVNRLNPVTVFVTLLFWGWLWGTWGLLLGIPIMIAINVICERTEGLQVVSHFLSGVPPERPRSAEERATKSDDQALSARAP
jgi:predicted PurR-regulated permease PerM